MFRDCESFEIVKNFLLESVPNKCILKSREEDNVLLVINENHSLYFLNYVAKDFFNLCDGNRKLKDIISIMLDEYDVDEKTLTDDLIDVIHDLQLKRIVFFSFMRG